MIDIASLMYFTISWLTSLCILVIYKSFSHILGYAALINTFTIPYGITVSKQHLLD